MSYLTLAKGVPNFSKAVISFWFRVPQKSLDKADANRSGADGGSLFDGIVPLVIMGQKGTDQTPIEVESEQALEYISNGFDVKGLGGTSQETTCIDEEPTVIPGIFICHLAQTTTSINPNGHFVSATSEQHTEVRKLQATGPAPPTNPTFIGVKGSRLYINFETKKKPNVQNLAFNESISPGSSIGPGPIAASGPGDAYSYGPVPAFPTGTTVIQYVPLGPGAVPGTTVIISDNFHWAQYPITETTINKSVWHYEDVSDLVVATGAIYSDGIDVAADEWHHVLISVELKTIKTHGLSSLFDSPEDQARYVDSASRLFVAVDDKNYTKDDLASNWPVGSEDPNAVITDDADSVAGSYPGIDRDGEPLGRLEYTLDSPEVPSGGEPIGLPGTSEFVNKIYRVEMAEFQMWTGVTLDTGIQKNRRAFVDEDGLPVDPTGTKDDPRGPGEKLLGKKPDILLHGSSNWQEGYNTGTLGVTENIDGKIEDIPSGQFTPTAKIEPYKPDPVLAETEIP